MKKIFVLFFAISLGNFALGQETATSAMHQVSVEELKIFSVLYSQKAAEYRALCYQAFNSAKWTLEQDLKHKKRKEKWAIVTDLDETIIDNSYFNAQLIKEGVDFTGPKWKQWTNLSAATAVPGAMEFLKWASSKGIEIFYISNRDTGEVTTTVINLNKLQLPNADAAHCLFRSNKSNKEDRRIQVASTHKIVMLMGDNLNDHAEVFEKKPIDERFAETDKAKEEWGHRYIVLPNAFYGEWENALYNYQRNLSTEQRKKILMDLLKGF